MRIAVLFDGAGLARLGLEQAGHDCIGFELDPIKHYLSSFVGDGNCILTDATIVDLSSFDAVWASPPCQKYSQARTQGAPRSAYAGDYLDWALAIDKEILWVENVYFPSFVFGRMYNANQFLCNPIQNRKRVIGGAFKEPLVVRPFNQYIPGLCPTITATEYRGCASDRRRASRYYGRRLTVDECAWHQEFVIPEQWRVKPGWFKGTECQWGYQLYEAIGNGVPVHMARGFGFAYEEK